jgi:hypothetical protein
LERLERAFPAVDEAGGDEAQLARAAGVDVAEVRQLLSIPEVAAALEAAQRAAEIDGSLLVVSARAAVLSMLRRINTEMAHGDVDLADIANLLPKAHRIVEHAEAADLKRNGADLPVIHITIGSSIELRQVTEVVEQVPAAVLVTPAVSAPSEPEPEATEYDFIAVANAAIAAGGTSK